MRTYKGTTKAKFMGTCFVEFSNYKDMEVCLKEYNHSVFHDAKKKIDRKINVELRYAPISLLHTAFSY
jgi:nucleolar protein 6